VAKLPQQQQAAPQSGTAGAPSRPGRRRLGRASLAGGVILTLSSPSAMAAGVCVAPSSALSGGLSSHQPVVAPICAGRAPLFWSGDGAMLTGKRLFGDAFPCAPSMNAYRSAAMLDLLRGQYFDRNRVGMYLSAAYMNAITNRTSFLKPSAVLAIWNQWQATGGNTGGYYTPTGGAAKWNARAIVAYLAGTMQ
jgi:hypothetical protein